MTTTKKRPRSKSARIPVNNRILRIEAAQEKTGLRKTMFEARRKDDPRFPKPIKLSARAIGFLEREIDAYIVDVLAKERAQ